MGALDEVRDLAEAVTRRHSLRLWDVEMGGAAGRAVVRVFVEGEALDLDTVAAVSDELSRALDLRDPIPGRYTLEVSSPGLERRLRSPEHFTFCTGRKAVVKTTEILVGDSHRIEGTIAEANENAVRIATEAGVVDVPYGAIRSAHTVFDWVSEGR